ncbi:acyl-CoA dehydrogenase family protein [Sinorhizobium mexicanum]|uniref:Acyl-CoA dehydrogenase n=1 Tax=Sinorhizobium mexicanum TaxID=375549 RepID=A0A859R8D3_9HYPH|nr:acyl-CoA dehydrogenase family protein [Sinorhizobium mexicanum]MBP1888089.1 (2S)-methylsuccinyl-CoA dehydrogenase [Sinorhizobium mexicanum]QLL65698.1 acyl-CoA dehydrogenase [Sinorhizobium mexicanum]
MTIENVSFLSNTAPDALFDAAKRLAGAHSDACLAGLLTHLQNDSGNASQKLNAKQRLAHGVAWTATLAEGVAAVADWARERSTPPELAAARLAVAEALYQLASGLAMSQVETFRAFELGVEPNPEMARTAAALLGEDAGASLRATLAKHIAAGEWLDDRLDDELDAMRDMIRRFAEDHISPHAHQWHLADALIPDTVVAQLAELGVFGICIPETHGGLGLGKLAMCVVTEELSRAWIAAGSLGTRSEIAGDLIAAAGTDAQKATWLPRLASGAVLPTAVFTEPDTGSDLGSLTARARQGEDGSWTITGAKTWITHASRSDLMTVLARTEPDVAGHRGLSMFLAAKTRGTEDAPFPDAGLTGSEIRVLGYRGMREYDLAFTGFQVGPDALLGGERGQGFRQLMQTFEGARIQTAARAVGVARNAMELGARYATERMQFGKPLATFPRVSDKIAQMAADTLFVRELTYRAARVKDRGDRSDIEAGMAKLLAARVAWANADAAMQIHGGIGYALETPISRVLCDARILSVFEGSAEIQAHVIGRGLLDRITQRNWGAA